MTTTPTFWGNEVRFSNLFTDFNPRVVALKDGTFSIVWQRQGGDLVGRHLNELGSFTGGDFLSALSGATTKTLGGPQVLQQADGLVMVHYNLDFGPGDVDIRGHSPSRDTPSAYSFPLEVTARSEILQDSTALAGGGSAYAFEYTDASGAKSLALRFVNASGYATSERIIVGTHGSVVVQQNAAIEGLQSGAVAVAYEQVNSVTGAREIRLQVRTEDGGYATGVWQASATDRNAAFPDITELANGRFVVVWQQAGGLAFREFGPNLAPIEAAATPIANSAGGFLPKITALNDGGFVVAWSAIHGTESDGSPDLDVFLQRFDGDGNAVGTQIHLDRPGDQGLFSLDLATLADGRVILTYQSETGDATNVTTLNYQIFDPRGSTITATNGDDNYVSREDGATIRGLAGNDRLTGREAKDVLDGGAGNDHLRGNGGEDSLLGGGGNDTLEGGAGNDLLRGGAGNDALYGGAGNDLVQGDAGVDLLFGGLGADRFRFDDGHTGLGALRDRIGDFSRAQGDKLDLSLIDANLARAGDQAFTFIGTGPFTGVGQLRVMSSGADRIVQGNNTGDLRPDFEIVLQGFNANVLAGDFDGL